MVPKTQQVFCLFVFVLGSKGRGAALNVGTEGMKEEVEHAT